MNFFFSSNSSSTCIHMYTVSLFFFSAGHSDVVQYLVLQGADVDLVDVKCQTSLYMAVKHKHLECIKILLRAGANPNGDLMSLCTPLYIAAMDGYFDGVVVSMIRFS